MIDNRNENALDKYVVQDVKAERLNAREVKISWKAPAMYKDKNLFYYVAVMTSKVKDWDVFSTKNTYLNVKLTPEISTVQVSIAYINPFTGQVDRHRHNTPFVLKITKESGMFQNMPPHDIKHYVIWKCG